MAVYDISGNSLSTVYGIDGTSLSQAYDISGNEIFSGSGTTIKVATYNVGGWYIGSGTNVPTAYKSEYVSLQQSILSAVDADILCFQEYWNEFCDDGTTADSVIGSYFTQQEKTNADSTWNGHVIASNGYTLSDYQSITFEHYYANAPSYEKCYITVDDKTIAVFNTHLSTAAGGMKEPQSEEMLAAVSGEEYFILMGDFNTEVSDYADIIQKFVDAGYNSANLNGSENYLYTYYTSGGVGKPTDQIITSANITISSVSVNTIKLSDDIGNKIDHIPLIAELIIT